MKSLTHLHDMNYKFDHNWFAQNIPNLEKLFAGVGDRPINILEIGSFEGRSTTWFMDNVPNSTIMCIDTWGGGMDHDRNNPDINFATVKANFDHNMKLHEGRYQVMESTSFDGLVRLNQKSQRYDFVFIDGSHVAADVLSDLVLSWPLASVGALIYCDDYYWGHNTADPENAPMFNFVFHTPKLGIDSFINTYGNKIKIMEGLTTPAAFVKVAE